MDSLGRATLFVNPCHSLGAVSDMVRMVASSQDAGPTLDPFKLTGGPPLLAGSTHVLRVVGCLQSSPSLCGTAEVSVMLRDSPLVARLAGGNRAVGVDD